MMIKRLYDTLVGASVAENQLCNGESVTVPNGHKFYLKKSGTESLGASAGTAITGLTSGTDMVIDLTQLLGTAIADYVYSLETATAGTGIAKLRGWGFLKGYQAYNTGSIESVEVTEKKVVGFNQWDEEWEVGAYNTTTGAKVSDSDRIRSKNLIPILPDTAYYFKFPYAIGTFGFSLLYYDADGNYISGGLKYGTLYTTPSDSRFIAFYTQVTYGTTYNHDICINLSSDRNGEYEPYKSITYDLGADTLRGLFKLDSENRLYADGDRKTSDGTVTRKYGVVDLGTLNWSRHTDQVTYGYFATTISNKAASFNFMTSKYVNSNTARGGLTDKSIGVYNIRDESEYKIICVRDDDYTDAASFKTAMSGIMLAYEAATPTTEQSTPFTNPQICDPDGTEEYVTSTGVPVGHETRYQL